MPNRPVVDMLPLPTFRAHYAPVLKHAKGVVARYKHLHGLNAFALREALCFGPVGLPAAAAAYWSVREHVLVDGSAQIAS